MGDRSDFEQMMAEYKSNYVEFLATGNQAYKTAYRNAQDAIEKMVAARQAQVESQKKDMQQFLFDNVKTKKESKSFKYFQNKFNDIDKAAKTYWKDKLAEMQKLLSTKLK